MPVLVEGISVLVRVDRIKDLYPGGLEAFQDTAPNATYCCDDGLARVGFLHRPEAQSFVAHLESIGFVYQSGGVARDLVAGDQQRGLLYPCHWAEWARSAVDGTGPICFARMIGAQGPVVVPTGWVFEGSLSQQFFAIEESAELTASRAVENTKNQTPEEPLMPPNPSDNFDGPRTNL